MKKSANTETRYWVVFSLAVLGLVAAVIILPNQFHSKAVNTGQDVSERTVPSEKGLEYYDIRTDKNQFETLINFRQTAGKSAVTIADARDKFVAGENALRSSVPTLKIEYNEDIRTPEVIGPDVDRGTPYLDRTVECQAFRHSAKIHCGQQRSDRTAKRSSRAVENDSGLHQPGRRSFLRPFGTIYQ